MSASVWVGEFITLASFIGVALSWALAVQTRRGPTRWTWFVTLCFLVTLALQVGKWRGA